MSSDNGIRNELVKKYRKEISEKKYKVKSKEIASKLAKEIFNHRSSSGRLDLKI